MSKKFKKILINVLKIVLPALIGWLEGDSHAIADAISNLLFLF